MSEGVRARVCVWESRLRLFLNIWVALRVCGNLPLKIENGDEEKKSKSMRARDHMPTEEQHGMECEQQKLRMHLHT